MTIRVPNRDVLTVIAHQDQQAVKFFEDLAAAANAAGGTTGSGGTLDMGDRIIGGGEYDGGTRL